MMAKAYVETTIVSYLTAPPSRDAITLGNQIATREWWSKGAHELDLLTSQVVVREAGKGDPTAAQERLKILATIPKLEATDGALMLARQLVEDGALPEKAAEDALHIAIAVVNAVDFLGRVDEFSGS
jgi:hypothetical protein